MGEMSNEPPVTIEQIDDRGMIHQVGRAILAGHLLKINAIGARGGRDLVRRASEANEGWAEIADIILDQLLGVALWIDGDEDQVHLLRGVWAELFDGRLHQEKRGWADIGAEGV